MLAGVSFPCKTEAEPPGQADAGGCSLEEIWGKDLGLLTHG